MTAATATVRDRRAEVWPRLAVLLWLLAMGATAAGLGLLASTNGASIPDSYGFPGFTSLFAISYATVGAIVVARRPDNRVGLVLLAAGLVAGVQTLYTEYAIVGVVVAPGSLPGAEIGAWLTAWAWLPFVYLAGPVLLSIFPDGKFLSERWALVPLFGAIASSGFLLLTALRKGPLNNFSVTDNPFGILPSELANILMVPAAVAMTAAFGLSAASLVARYRRADLDRRQQLKWIAVAAVVVGIVAPLGFGLGLGKAGQIAFIVSLCGLPIATGIAVMRYRLYEIDTLINRALVYGLLTAVIAGLYTASIGLMQRLSRAVTGADSEATIVVTTIVIVVAFTPIKSRLQALVDGRFKEAKDPRAQLEAFTKALESRMWRLDVRLVAQRLAEAIVASLGSAQAVLTVRQPGGSFELTAAKPDSTAHQSEWSTSAAAGSTRLDLTLRVGHPLSDRDGAAVTAALGAVARELEVAG